MAVCIFRVAKTGAFFARKKHVRIASRHLLRTGLSSLVFVVRVRVSLVAATGTAPRSMAGRSGLVGRSGVGSVVSHRVSSSTQG